MSRNLTPFSRRTTTTTLIYKISMTIQQETQKTNTHLVIAARNRSYDRNKSKKMDHTSSNIVFFDLETTVPNRTGDRFRVLEFGAIVVCPRKLVEVESFSTLIRPKDLSSVSVKSSRCDGITRGAVANAPEFEEVAGDIFRILDGKIWAGHNIQRFDCVRIKEAFAEIGKPAPVPVGIIDSLGVLAHKFGKRAGNMKMASLAAYFGLGQQKHRSLDDVRMNLEVLKHCATVLFLESSLPSVLDGKWTSSTSTITTRSRSNYGKLSTSFIRDQDDDNNNNGNYSYNTRKSPPSTALGNQRSIPYARSSLGQMTEGVKELLCKAQETKSVNNLLNHSHSLLP